MTASDRPGRSSRYNCLASLRTGRGGPGLLRPESTSVIEKPKKDHEPARESVTRVLAELREGTPGASARLVELVYGELRQIAGRHFRKQPPGHTLQPTAVVHEACLRLFGTEQPAWEDRAHFFAAAAAAMRSVLVDHARYRNAQRRGGGQVKLQLDEALDGVDALSAEILAVHDALDSLNERSPRPGQVVELLFFGGFSVAETAEVIGVSASTVRNDWRYARAWLYREIHPA